MLIFVQGLTPFSLGHPTFEQVLAHLDSVSRDPTRRGPVVFHWPITELNGLVFNSRIVTLCESHEIRKFDYDYSTQTVFFDTMGQSRLHYKVQKGLRDFLEEAIEDLAESIDDPTMKLRLENVSEDGTAEIVMPGRLQASADVSFTETLSAVHPVQRSFPSFVCEICWGQSTQYIEDKAIRYLTCTRGRMAAVLIIKMEYPTAEWITFSLVVADAASGAPRWVHRNQLLYADDGITGEYRPAGEIGLYLSDLLSPQQPVPFMFRRPSAAEAAVGIVWYVFYFCSPSRSPLMVSVTNELG